MRENAVYTHPWVRGSVGLDESIKVMVLRKCKHVEVADCARTQIVMYSVNTRVGTNLGLRTVPYTAYGRIIYGTNTVTGTRKP